MEEGDEQRREGGWRRVAQLHPYTAFVLPGGKRQSGFANRHTVKKWWKG